MILLNVVAMFLEAALFRLNEKCEGFSSFAVAVDFSAYGGGMHTAARNLGIVEDKFVTKQKFWFVGPNATQQHAVCSRHLRSMATGLAIGSIGRSFHPLAPIVQKI